MRKNVEELVDIILLDKLGKDANGVVYLALSNSLGLVAAKTLHILLHPERYFVEAEGQVCLEEEDHFRQEVESMMKFSHPNIVKCFGVWFMSKGTIKIPHMIFELGECAFDAFLYSNKISQAQNQVWDSNCERNSIFAHAPLNSPQRHQACKYGLVQTSKSITKNTRKTISRKRTNNKKLKQKKELSKNKLLLKNPFSSYKQQEREKLKRSVRGNLQSRKLLKQNRKLKPLKIDSPKPKKKKINTRSN